MKSNQWTMSTKEPPIGHTIATKSRRKSLWITSDNDLIVNDSVHCVKTVTLSERLYCNLHFERLTSLLVLFPIGEVKRGCEA